MEALLKKEGSSDGTSTFQKERPYAASKMRQSGSSSGMLGATKTRHQ